MNNHRNTELNHLDKINIFYSKGSYTLQGNPVSDLSKLYGMSCGLSNYDYPKSAIMSNLLETFNKINVAEKTITSDGRIKKLFTNIFLEKMNNFRYGENITIDTAIHELVMILRHEQVFRFSMENGEEKKIDIYGLGKPEDNLEMLGMIKPVGNNE